MASQYTFTKKEISAIAGAIVAITSIVAGSLGSHIGSNGTAGLFSYRLDQQEKAQKEADDERREMRAQFAVATGTIARIEGELTGKVNAVLDGNKSIDQRLLAIESAIRDLRR